MGDGTDVSRDRLAFMGRISAHKWRDKLPWTVGKETPPWRQAERCFTIWLWSDYRFICTFAWIPFKIATFFFIQNTCLALMQSPNSVDKLHDLDIYSQWVLTYSLPFPCHMYCSWTGAIIK